jgi:hypothetical protein
VKPTFTGLAARLRNGQGVLVDSNILLDIATDDPKWSEWSGRALSECTEHAALVINPIIYAEVSIGDTNIEALNTALPSSVYQRDPLPWGRASWPASASWPIADGEAREIPRCRTSTLVRTLRLNIWHCLRETQRVFRRTSRNLRSSRHRRTCSRRD